MLRYIVLIVYLAAVNIYGFVLVRSLRNAMLERNGTAAKNGSCSLRGFWAGRSPDTSPCSCCDAARTTPC